MAVLTTVHTSGRQTIFSRLKLHIYIHYEQFELHTRAMHGDQEMHGDQRMYGATETKECMETKE